MQLISVVSVALLGFAAAAPVAEPQDIDFDAYNAIPNAPDITAPVGVVPQVVDYSPAGAAASAAAASISDLSKRGSCLPEPAGNYPTVTPDDPTDFLANPAFATAAESAVAPPGYFLAEGYQNLQASASDPSYLTYVSSQLTSYDPATCAALCTNIAGCVSFNIYFERDPSIYLDSVACPTAPSVTRIKCSFFGTAITVADATNVGQYQDDFQIVIAGSNVYTTAPQPLPGFTGPVSLGDAAISAPTADGTYMGVQTFPQTQPYDPSVCATACNEKSAYNTRHAVAGVAPRICVFFDAYILYKNGVNGVFTCTYYTEAYGPSYATNFGQYDSEGDHYTVAHSYTYTVSS